MEYPPTVAVRYLLSTVSDLKRKPIRFEFGREAIALWVKCGIVVDRATAEAFTKRSLPVLPPSEYFTFSGWTAGGLPLTVEYANPAYSIKLIGETVDGLPFSITTMVSDELNQYIPFSATIEEPPNSIGYI